MNPDVSMTDEERRMAEHYGPELMRDMVGRLKRAREFVDASVARKEPQPSKPPLLGQPRRA